MPEGPEIRRAADRIAKRLVGREIEAIELHYPPIREFQSVVSDSQIVSVASRGKAMLTSSTATSRCTATTSYTVDGR